MAFTAGDAAVLTLQLPVVATGSVARCHRCDQLYRVTDVYEAWHHLSVDSGAEVAADVTSDAVVCAREDTDVGPASGPVQ